NEFVGMNCGIMDHFASALGREDHAIFLNCKTLAYVHVPLSLENHSLVIVNTNKKRGLVDSKYNERRSECERGLQYLRQARHWSCLGEISVQDFMNSRQLIPDQTIDNRVTHVLTENKRVLEAAKALHRKDLAYFGQLMMDSHASLSALYEVSCEELDILVDEAYKVDGVLGARMTGGGFGGCTVNLMQTSVIEQFIDSVGKAYHSRTGLSASFYLPKIGDGARQIE
ncbi:MAG: galactokinase, partial [Bacteroidetes bacterium]|nr:galactokinase [Bacteroidota bacterium]